ncbi:uncharacterized protein PgNI_03001 [Pyricularia grisea]|uniref:Uncharacterized protein n=1 Tax=Pyricularia grisea TaxID=148305 RepID=A0A6P8BC72_PYRGI|nr:uncharacterized protein PgNI_03001 [Pyricularia grisea]TLD13430.1 hypothetical protein PgNI_03001 [Pyricularia grisea]
MSAHRGHRKGGDAATSELHVVLYEWQTSCQKNNDDEGLAEDLYQINSRKERAANNRDKIQFVDKGRKKESPHEITSTQRRVINGYYMQSRGSYDGGPD